MFDLSNNGVSYRFISSIIFPAGFTITEWADDSDPFDLPELEIATPSMNLNGDLIVFSKPEPVLITLNVIPDSDADRNLAIVFEANKSGKGRRQAGDICTLIGVYPNGNTTRLSEGKMISGTPGLGVDSSGKGKTASYKFAFQNMIRGRGL